MYKEKEMATQMETERKRAIKPPLRYLPEEERSELLNVSGDYRCYGFSNFFIRFRRIRFAGERCALFTSLLYSVTGTEGQLERIAQGIPVVADGHRHSAQSEEENHVGKATQQSGKRH